MTMVMLTRYRIQGVYMPTAAAAAVSAQSRDSQNTCNLIVYKPRDTFGDALVSFVLTALGQLECQSERKKASTCAYAKH